ncbi:MAG: type II toxin-antitoxin system RelE/ParE family toxin [Gemmatimonadaceae bacterium]|nr:type II toxin-antitoxin system RelE/ParE family toxin [Gemmatimonadaceae bacterium]
MSNRIYSSREKGADRPLVWLRSEIKTPPFSSKARVEAGVLIRRLQQGGNVSLPHSRPMPSIGRGCHELRIRDGDASWRIIYRLDYDAVVIVDVFRKTTRATQMTAIRRAKQRLRSYGEDNESR